jgi:hypothetical protein
MGFKGDAREAIRALLHDLAILAADYGSGETARKFGAVLRGILLDCSIASGGLMRLDQGEAEGRWPSARIICGALTGGFGALLSGLPSRANAVRWPHWPGRASP